MRRLLIVSHCPSPNTRLLTDAVAEGAMDEGIDGVEVKRLAPLEAGPEDVLASDAILLGTTENFGYMSGALKDFFERTYYPCLERTQGLPCGLFIRAGNDGSGARQSVERILTGLKWHLVQPPLILAGPFQTSFTEPCKELGMTLAAGLEAGIY